MRTITFYSYKGGVGRSLALSNIATRLAEIGKKVCIIDFDLDAPGLHFKFNDYERPEQIEKGLVDYIFRYAVEGIAEKKIKDFSIQLKPIKNTLKPITFIPAGNIESDDYWEKLSVLPWSKLFYSEDGDGIDFFLDLKAKIETEIAPDFLLIDSRTGITDISAITLKIFADEVVVLAANNEENLFGCKRILKNLYDPDKALFGNPPKVTFLLTRLPFEDTPKDNEAKFVIQEKVRKEMMEALKLDEFECMLIHSDSSLEIEEKKMIGYEYQLGVSISNDYLRLFDALTVGFLDSYEMQRFNQVRFADKEFAKGQSEEDTLLRLKHYTSAIELNGKKADYFIARGLLYSDIERWDDAIKDFKSAIKVGDLAQQLSVNIAYCYMRKGDHETALNYLSRANNYTSVRLRAEIQVELKEYEEALNLINFILDRLPTDHVTLNMRAGVYRDLNMLDLAYRDAYRALELSPEDEVYFATLAEIYALDNKLNEFYLNLSVALSFGLQIEHIIDEKSIYSKFMTDERFLSLMRIHNFDLDELELAFNEEQ
ncbi:tetratricopeptide repeat protein [Mucilaginibacter oryzae]|uniref:Tetratricopeptide repeat protein n=1 Tax=Mucilaginibacter oryzae TaxID=468058 RepID=A0A316GY76_9SPHI|nr:AAA family ATPase [Mucilaginibacter oryzae]PWK68266.1 tetratricopeptide repeat protein [Mucilaginibacter oryzae]